MGGVNDASRPRGTSSHAADGAGGVGPATAAAAVAPSPTSADGLPPAAIPAATAPPATAMAAAGGGRKAADGSVGKGVDKGVDGSVDEAARAAEVRWALAALAVVTLAAVFGGLLAAGVLGDTRLA